MGRFTHLDSRGSAHMVPVAGKETTHRVAEAEGAILMSAECFEAVRHETVKKGDVLSVARVAGIMGAKGTADIIPLCHPLLLTHATVDFIFKEKKKKHVIIVRSRVECEGQTGVEMEALTAVSCALLTIYDMCKSIDRSMEMGRIRLVRKSGGRSGVFVRKAAKTP